MIYYIENTRKFICGYSNNIYACHGVAILALKVPAIYDIYLHDSVGKRSNFTTAYVKPWLFDRPTFSQKETRRVLSARIYNRPQVDAMYYLNRRTCNGVCHLVSE